MTGISSNQVSNILTIFYPSEKVSGVVCVCLKFLYRRGNKQTDNTKVVIKDKNFSKIRKFWNIIVLSLHWISENQDFPKQNYQFVPNFMQYRNTKYPEGLTDRFRKINKF